MTLASAFIRDPFRTARFLRKSRREATDVHRAADAPGGLVVSYGHPKTATTSAARAIDAVPGRRAFHAHVLRPVHFTWIRNNLVPPTPAGICPEDGPAQWALADALAADRPVRLVTLVRDPVAVQISWFFFGLQRWLGSTRPVDPTSVPFEDLLALFHGDFPRDGVLNWFDEEWCVITGRSTDSLGDVRDGRPARVGFGIHEACVLSAEWSDDLKAAALDDFLGLPSGSIRFPRENRSSDRRGADVYTRLKAAIGGDRDHLDRVYDSPFSRTFFSDETIDGFRRRWTSRAS